MNRAVVFLLSIAIFPLCWRSASVSAHPVLPQNRKPARSKPANYQEAQRRRRRMQQEGKGGGGGNNRNTVNNTNTGYGTTRGKGVNTANIFADPWMDDSSDGDSTSNSPGGKGASPPAEGIVKSPTAMPTSGAPVIPSFLPTTTAPSPMPQTLAPVSPQPSTAAPSITAEVVEPLEVVVPQCETTFGVFGLLEGESHTIQFGYELETDPAKINAADGDDDDVLQALRDQVLPLLEIKLNDMILAVIFPRLCVAAALDEEEQVVEQQEYRLIEGISARPDDVLMVNDDDKTGGTTPLRCLQLHFADSNCHLVRGGVTIYGPYSDVSYNIDDSARVLNALETIMNNSSSLLESMGIPSIRRITYVNLDDDDDDGQSVAQSTGDATTTNNSNDKSPVLPIALASAGGLCAVALAWAYRRGQMVNSDLNSSLAADTAGILVSSPEPTTPRRYNA